MRTKIKRDAIYLAPFGNCFETEIPGGAVIDCTVPGQDAESSVQAWLPAIKRPERLTPDALRDELEEYGAWSREDGELDDDSENWERMVWLLCGNVAEEDEPYEVTQ